MKIIAIYSNKGGVGKTATSVNLSYLCSRDYRTLLCDLDAQGSSTYYFKIQHKLSGGVKSLLKGKHLDDNIKATDYPNLDLLPSDQKLRNLDMKLAAARDNQEKMRKNFHKFANIYDYIFLDCPPVLNTLTENVFQMSDILLIPVIPSTLSQRALQSSLDFIEDKKHKHLQIYPFISMIDKRKNMHKNTKQALFASFPFFLQTEIPYSSDIENMGNTLAPIAHTSHKSKSSLAYHNLWWEIVENIG